MSADSTAQKLASITHAGDFERLATAVLRHAEPLCRNLLHCGVNAAGQTIPSPLDGICFVLGADPPHMVAVHHTITRREGLRTKWLRDSSAVQHLTESLSEAPNGDLIKTAAKAREERQRTPKLRATLVLSTNQDPSEDLVRDVHAAGAERGIEVEIWSRSRLCHVLDNDPTGQWIRRQHLGIEEEQLSIELLRDLSIRSLEAYAEVLQDAPSMWVDRALDGLLDERASRKLTFVVGAAGSGKSVACYRRLKSHLDAGGVGLVVRHEDVASETRLEAAVVASLRKLHPKLAQIGPTPFSLCTFDKPLLLVIEDINHAPQPRLLVERLTVWARDNDKSAGRKTQGKNNSDASNLPPWRILCPSWPVNGLQDRVPQEFEENLVVMAEVFAPGEGQEAVLQREQAAGCAISPLKASETSEALGHDPLLIALHKPGEPQDAHQVIGTFVEGALWRTAEENNTVTPGDGREALRALAREMLRRRQLELVWREIRAWDGLRDGPMQVIAVLARSGELLRLTGHSGDQRLSFRHDRVRDWLLSDTAADMERRGELSDELLQDPYFAEVFGNVLVFDQPTKSFVDRIAAINPLALFCGLRLLGSPKSPAYAPILAAAMAWLDGAASQQILSNARLRAEALRVLCETDLPCVPTLVSKLGVHGSYADVALLRNGDLAGGIRLCARVEPGCEFPWRDLAIEHAKVRYGGAVIEKLGAVLKDQTVDGQVRSGALRLAGHIADQGLVSAVETCWNTDVGRAEHLDDYLWAFAKCCGPDVARYLAPVCDAWGSLSDKADSPGMGSPRSSLAAFGLKWALCEQPPPNAVEYLVLRAESDQSLRWPITYLLHGIDLPCAVNFVVHDLAESARRLEGTERFSSFVASAPEQWRRAQKQGRPMSATSRSMLQGLWQDRSNDKHLREQAFALWAATTASDDIRLLRGEPGPDDLSDKYLWERLRRGDAEAIPALLDKLESDQPGHWWWAARHVWSDEVTGELDAFLTKRAANAPQAWEQANDADYITSELLMRLPQAEAAGLLEKHWAHLRFTGLFVQAALYVGTPWLLAEVRATVSECPSPGALFKHITQHYGHHTRGHPGVTRESQVEALEPYLDFLEPMPLRDLWEACNKHRWFGTRRRLLDARQDPPFLLAGHELEQISAEMDGILSRKHLHFLDHCLDRFLEAGIAWADLLGWIVAWLEQRRSFEALTLVATAITLRGTRKDLDVLDVCNILPESQANSLVADTRFTVCRSRLR